ncbi:MAG: GtrA family protein [Bifidobacteriaceae bacterium]|nr:GtrA family protein [Bifidobacteriaceae bacterium]
MGFAATFFHKITNRSFIRQVVLYGVFGLVAAGADFAAFRGLRGLGVGLFAANVVSVNLGITVSFLSNAFLNFRRTDALARRALIFFCVGWSGLALSTLILWIGVSQLGADENIVKIVSIGLVAMYQFTLNKLVTFSAGSRSRQARQARQARPARPATPRGTALSHDAAATDPAEVPASPGPAPAAPAPPVAPPAQAPSAAPPEPTARRGPTAPAAGAASAATAAPPEPTARRGPTASAAVRPSAACPSPDRSVRI